MSLEVLRSHREAILRVARRRKATNVRVFGSFARGTARKDSDIDFLVSMAPDATLVDLIGLEQDLEALLGREVNVATDDEPPTPFQEEVRRTAMRL
jgi:hypothetical protein